MKAIAPGEARIVIVDHEAATGQRAVYDALVERLRGSGYRPVRYKNTDAFHASGAIADADIVAATSAFPCNRAFLARGLKLRAMVCAVTGTEGYDIKAATELGILVANGQSPENCESMAEATIMLILSLLYDLDASAARLRSNQLRPMHTRASMLKGKLLGFIGFGAIAREVAMRLAVWGVRMQAYSPRPIRDLPDAIVPVDLDTLLSTSDIVSLHATLNDETRGMLDRTNLERMKHGAAFVNTARGGIVDEVALAEIAHAKDLRLAIDVFATKPLVVDSPLRDVPNAILTPHMVGHTRELDELQIDAAFENITRVLAGNLPLYIRNPAAIAAWQRRWAAEPVQS